MYLLVICSICSWCALFQCYYVNTFTDILTRITFIIRTRLQDYVSKNQNESYFTITIFYVIIIPISLYLFGVYFPSMPWDRSYYLGYLGEICYVLCGGVTYILSTGALLLSFISLCLHHRAFFRIFQYFINRMNDPNQNHGLFFTDFFKFHNVVKE